MQSFFSDIEPIRFSANTDNALHYRYYDPTRKILGKTMEEHLRIGVCFWHTFCWSGSDIFGESTFTHPWHHTTTDPMQQATLRAAAAFEFVEKLGLKYYTFHDRDVAPDGRNLRETQDNLSRIVDLMAGHMQRTGAKLLWGTANLTHHKRYMAGAATNPNPEIFSHAVAQVKHCLDMTQKLQGENYVLWGGREGYDTLLNTDLSKEMDQMGRFLTMLVDYKHKIGFKGTLLIEPKPCEPSKHQYDFDTATVFAFLQKYGLEKEFRVNIEANHATLAGHSFAHEVAYAFAANVFGSIDANQGDPQLGWDTDQFPTRLDEIAQVMYLILQHGGFTTGGFNLDTKLRRQSTEISDLFYGHISGIDGLARGLIIAAQILEKGVLQKFTEQRYQQWQTPYGKDILAGKMDFEKIAAHVLQHDKEPQLTSGRQEMLETMFGRELV